MNLKIITTKDGSNTLLREDLDEIYHSRNGALSESVHVFIEAGLQYKSETQAQINILEVGLGTGLNLLLTIDWFLKQNQDFEIYYYATEPYPISWELIQNLGYQNLDTLPQTQELFGQVAQANWETEIKILDNFIIFKTQNPIQDINTNKDFELVYFDAFAPEKQAEMWEKKVFEKIYKQLAPQGCLVTYSAKGQLKRDLKTCGFEVQSLPGPNRKREMTRALK